jgi:hypothetical protein
MSPFLAQGGCLVCGAALQATERLSGTGLRAYLRAGEMRPLGDLCAACKDRPSARGPRAGTDRRMSDPERARASSPLAYVVCGVCGRPVPWRRYGKNRGSRPTRCATCYIAQRRERTRASAVRQREKAKNGTPNVS